MLTQSLEIVLQRHPFLADLSREHIHTLISCASNQRFEQGHYLAREGAEAESFYLLRSGTVALQIHSPTCGGIRMNTAGPGEILGWSWLVPPHQWHFDALAIEPVRAIVLDGLCLRQKCERDHELGYQLLKRFSTLVEQRLDAACMQLIDVYGVPSR